MRQRISLVVVTCLALFLPAAAAHASSRQFTTVEAPDELLNGSPDHALDEVQSLGATAIRIQLLWKTVAPDPDAARAPRFNATDPNAYAASGWAPYDAAINAARRRGLKVVLTLTGPAPKWATSTKKDNLTNPSPADYGRFATAVGRRYGKQVSWWTIWNEPNLGKMLQPLYKGKTSQLASAVNYRYLYLNAYSGLHSAGVRAPILIGDLAPRANGLRVQGTIAPLRFLRAALCLSASYKKSRTCARVPTDGIATHPYTTKAGPRMTPSNKDEVTIGVIGRMVAFADRAARAGALPARLPIYLTEFGVQSVPNKLAGVSLALQADYRSLAEYMAFKNPRVASFSQYLLRDAPSRDGLYGNYQMGLQLNSGKDKPALEGFRLPLVVLAKNASARGSLWGMVRPAHGKAQIVTVQYTDGHGWKKLGRVRTSSAGYWTKHITNKRGRGWRVQWTDPATKRTHTGPKTMPH